MIAAGAWPGDRAHGGVYSIMTVSASNSPPGRTNIGADLVRIVIVASCRLKASFNDGTVLVLSDSAESFVIMQGAESRTLLISQPDHPCHSDFLPSSGGKTSSQLTQYALSKHMPRLAVALEFRNLHLDQPYSHSKLQSETDNFTSGVYVNAYSHRFTLAISFSYLN